MIKLSQLKMDFQKQSLKLPVMNVDALVGERIDQPKKHGPLLPNSIRAVFCGPSGCGKTNALISLIIHPNGLKFENIYIYSKSLNQPKYMFLKDLLQSINGMKYFAFNDGEQVISPDRALPNSLMIFDDIACEKQDSLKAFFCMGRHKCVDSFYLCQSYAQVPKHLVRDNVNFLAIFHQDEMNLRHIYNDHVNTDMSFENFRKMCLRCWRNGEHCFIVVDKTSGMKNGRFRKGFDEYLIN